MSIEIKTRCQGTRTKELVLLTLRQNRAGQGLSGQGWRVELGMEQGERDGWDRSKEWGETLAAKRKQPRGSTIFSST